MGHYQAAGHFRCSLDSPAVRKPKSDTLGSPNNLPAELRGDSFAA